jgi:hypothetical protein
MGFLDTSVTASGFCTNASRGGNGMGIGRLGDADIAHKRKYQWVMQVSYCNNRKTVPAYLVKTASRPNISIEEIEINFLNAKTWIPGKATPEAVTVTYYDVATDDNIELLSWLATIYDFSNPTCLNQNSRRSDYAGSIALAMLDGCGNPIELWGMNDAFPTSYNFGDLDYSASEVMEIEVSIRYSQLTYKNLCGNQPTRCPCTPCGSSSGTVAAGLGNLGSRIGTVAAGLGNLAGI